MCDVSATLHKLNNISWGLKTVVSYIPGKGDKGGSAKKRLRRRGGDVRHRGDRPEHK